MPTPSSGFPNRSNVTTTQIINANFVQKNGATIPVRLVVPMGSVSIGNTLLLDTNELDKTVQALFPPQSK